MKINNPAFNYDGSGCRYSNYRQTDPRIADYINEALGTAKTILNVGAGAGSYEPENHYVIAVEPSVKMRLQRLANKKYPAIIGTVDLIPFDDDAFDASMAILTIHHWQNIAKGLREIKRVTRDKIIIMTFDPDALDNFWNAKYFKDVVEVEKSRYPKINDIIEILGLKSEVKHIPIPLDCKDGFQEAYYGRPEAFLNKDVRLSQSAWGFISVETENLLVKKLADDLASGELDRLYGHYRTAPAFTCALRLIIAFKQIF